MFNATSLVVMSQYRESVIQCVAPIFSVVLTKPEGIHDKLISPYVVGLMKIKINWLLMFGIIFTFYDI